MSNRTTHLVYVWPAWMANPQLDPGFDGTYRPPKSEFYYVLEYIDTITFMDKKSLAQERTFTISGHPGNYLKDDGTYIYGSNDSSNVGNWCEAFTMTDTKTGVQVYTHGFMNFSLGSNFEQINSISSIVPISAFNDSNAIGDTDGEREGIPGQWRFESLAQCQTVYNNPLPTNKDGLAIRPDSAWLPGAFGMGPIPGITALWPGNTLTPIVPGVSQQLGSTKFRPGINGSAPGTRYSINAEGANTDITKGRTVRVNTFIDPFPLQGDPPLTASGGAGTLPLPVVLPAVTFPIHVEVILELPLFDAKTGAQVSRLIFDNDYIQPVCTGGTLPFRDMSINFSEPPGAGDFGPGG